MKANELQIINDNIDKLEKIGIEKAIAQAYTNKDLNTVNIGQFSLIEYTELLTRSIKQLKEELAVNGKILPNQFNFQNEYSAGQLTTEIQNITRIFDIPSEQQLINSIPHLNRIIYYQIANGFWDKSTTKIHNVKDINTLEHNTKLKLIEEQLVQNTTSYNTLVESIDKVKKELNDFVVAKKEELQQISNNLQASNNNSNQISELLNKSTSTNEKINSTLSQQNNNLEAQKKKNEELLKDIVKTKNENNGLKLLIEKELNELVLKNSEFIKNLEFVESKKTFFEERNQYLEELIGREVGASLFETFRQRKLELDKPIARWLKVTIGAALLTFIAVIAIFTNFFGCFGDLPSTFTWQQVIINSVKTLPFFFLLFYSISQYNKERNYQEEYAFKSAVALTIKAYSDIIVEQNLKDSLIIDSVSEIYKSPINKSKKKEDNSILDTATELLNTALDVMKKK